MMFILACILLVVLFVVAFSISLSLLLPILAAGAIFFCLRFIVSNINDDFSRTFLDGGFGLAVFIILVWLIV